jgi:hypothetical protein
MEISLHPETAKITGFSMKWSRDLQLLESSTVVLDRLNVIIDRLNVISSGSVVYMKIGAKVCFQGPKAMAIFEVESGRNLVEMQTVPINTMLEYSRSNSNETCRLMVTF